MEGVVEDDDRLAPGGGAGNLDSVLEGLGAGVDEVRPTGHVARHQLVQALRQRDIALIRGHLEARVGETGGLLGHSCRDQLRGRADRENGDAGAEVDERVAVHVQHHPPAGPLGEDGHRPSHGVGDGSPAAFHQGQRARAGNLGHKGAALWEIGGSHFFTFQQVVLNQLLPSLVTTDSIDNRRLRWNNERHGVPSVYPGRRDRDSPPRRTVTSAVRKSLRSSTRSRRAS